MQPLQICIGPTIRIWQENWCLPYAGFLETNRSVVAEPPQKLQAFLQILIPVNNAEILAFW